MAITTPKNRKELEDSLRRAFEVDRILPPVFKRGGACFLGKMVVIPDDERNPDDVMDDFKETFTRDDYELWLKSNEWMATVHGIEFEIIRLRCSNMGWKRIARMVIKKNLAYRVLDRATLWRYFCSGLDSMLARIGGENAGSS